MIDVEQQAAEVDEQLAAVRQQQADLADRERSLAAIAEALGEIRSVIDPGGPPAPANGSWTPRALCWAVHELGGTADLAAVKELLGLDDGRALIGSRRAAIDHGWLEFGDGLFRLAVPVERILAPTG